MKKKMFDNLWRYDKATDSYTTCGEEIKAEMREAEVRAKIDVIERMMKYIDKESDSLPLDALCISVIEGTLEELKRKLTNINSKLEDKK